MPLLLNTDNLHINILLYNQNLSMAYRLYAMHIQNVQSLGFLSPRDGHDCHRQSLEDILLTHFQKSPCRTFGIQNLE